MNSKQDLHNNNRYLNFSMSVWGVLLHLIYRNLKLRAVYMQNC
jgi:hypothetical protein